MAAILETRELFPSISGWGKTWQGLQCTLLYRDDITWQYSPGEALQCQHRPNSVVDLLILLLVDSEKSVLAILRLRDETPES